MATEIERKFLVHGDAWKTGKEGVRLRQGYLTSQPGGATVRVRVAGGRAWLTVKGPGEGIERVEFEYEVPPQEAGEMLLLCQERTVEKVRYRVEHGGHTWEVDVFHGPNRGLVLAEVELADAGEEVDRPAWAGEEVSGDPRYYNAALAMHPIESW